MVALRTVSIKVVHDGSGISPWEPTPIEVDGPVYVPRMVTTRIYAGAEPFLKASDPSDREVQDLIDKGWTIDEIRKALEG